MLLLKVLDFMTDPKNNEAEREIERETVKVGNGLSIIAGILFFLALMYLASHLGA